MIGVLYHSFLKKEKEMNKTIITTDDLLEYLKISDFNSKENQEVSIKKITQQGVILEEFLDVRVFELTYREISLPRTLYIDSNNIVCFRHRFSDENIFYKPVSYKKNEDVYTEDQISGTLTTLLIPEEIYNGGYRFYINQENQIVASVQSVSISNSKNYIAFKPSSFSYLKEYPIVTYYYTNVYGASVNEKNKNMILF